MGGRKGRPTSRAEPPPADEPSAGPRAEPSPAGEPSAGPRAAAGRSARWKARAGAAAYRVALLLLRAWWVLARPRSSGVRCVIRHGDDILLVRHSYGDRRWMLPGGRVGRGEDPAATATREMAQELGVACPEWTVTGCNAARAAYRRPSRDEPFRRHSTWYLAGEAPDRAVRPRAVEIDEARWFSPAALPVDRSEALDEAVARGWLR
jgi:8-oxo-dGTP pyrophosphatase MutT (NUDIX family)